MSTQGLNQVLVAMRGVHVETAREFEGELDRCAEIVARRMRRHAPKFRSLLALGVRTLKAEPYVRDIGPTAAYAAAQEEGVKPGGKGLPPFDSAEAADMKAWLTSKASGMRAAASAAKGSGAIAAISLRDRYYGMAKFLRRSGMKPTPFVAISLQESENEIRERLAAAGERITARSAGGATA